MMKVTITTTMFSLALAALSFAAAAADGPPPPTSGLALNEVMAGPASDWDGSGAFSSRDDEWIEVRNVGAATIDLAGYYVTDGDTIPRYAFSGTLASGDRLVVYGSDAYAWERDSGHPAYGLSLSNSGDTVLLWQVAGGDTTLVDQCSFGSHAAAADRSIGRLDDHGDWTLFDGFNPYNGSATPSGTGCNPSPGSANICAVTPTRGLSWGAIKAAYR
jgi:hypothetical protein